ncbi:hypothetical protein [Ligilactobacillus equi]|uniref:Membrane protein 6-pyruvoyl-tetrahydropterin synthase-related domain-containing protein n=1 Tax=Ligilactobacillus equi DPC 6820 TaxID=1392007 RepID=V7HXE5_9LACO|nr:hypothetical protein [Ligilactobacillus equi]ETA73726.1 hypothetical protein LEQ_1360c [Ligilactobacillus equi DPC 6820]
MLKSNLKKDVTAIFIFLISCSIVMLPFIHSGTLHAGVDMSFHLNRIYDLYKNIQNGNAFSYISTYSFNQLGTFINMVYGFLPLYPMAICMIIFKNPIEAVYMGILFFMWISMIISYMMGIKFWGSRKKSLIFAFLYIFSEYTFNWWFKTFGLGQVIACSFLPLIFYGLYSIFYNDKKEWYFLSLGMIGVIYTHILSVMIYSIVIFFVLVLITISDWHRTIKNIKYLVYAIMSSFLATLFYWVTLLSAYGYDISTTKEVDISTAGIKFGDSIMNALNSGDSLGPLIVVVTIMGIGVWKKQSKMNKAIIILGIFSFCATTTLFDVAWNFLNNTPIKAIQWPGRILMISNFFLAVSSVDTFEILVGKSRRVLKYFVVCSGVIFLSLSSVYTLLNTRKNQTIIDYNPTSKRVAPFSDYQLTSTKGFKYFVTGYNVGVGSSDYWPKVDIGNAKIQEDLRNHIAYVGNKSTKVKYKSIPNGIEYILNTNKSGVDVDLPFFNYGNYSVKANGEKITYYKTKRSTIGIRILKKGTNEIKIVYQPSKCFRFVKWISIVTISLIVLYGISSEVGYIRTLSSANTDL